MQASFLKKLLKKYNNGTATEAERLIVDTWYESFDEDQLFIPGIRTREETSTTRENIFARIAPQTPKTTWYNRSWLRLTASVAILMGAYASYQYFQPRTETTKEIAILSKTYQTGVKEVKKILLQDSTVIWLNANSSLTLKKNYGRGSRQVQLSGEANFEVKRDTLRPFIVDASELQVRVLGTSFNVRNYQHLSQIKVSVTRGKVSVNERHKQLALLTKNQGLDYDKKAELYQLVKIDSTNHTAWTAGKVVLQKAGYDELKQAMLNLYGVNLLTADDKVKSFLYNITLRSNQRKEEVLKNLMIILQNKKFKQEGSNEIRIY